MHYANKIADAYSPGIAFKYSFLVEESVGQRLVGNDEKSDIKIQSPTVSA